MTAVITPKRRVAHSADLVKLWLNDEFRVRILQGEEIYLQVGRRGEEEEAEAGRR